MLRKQNEVQFFVCQMMLCLKGNKFELLGLHEKKKNMYKKELKPCHRYNETHDYSCKGAFLQQRNQKR